MAQKKEEKAKATHAKAEKTAVKAKAPKKEAAAEEKKGTKAQEKKAAAPKKEKKEKKSRKVILKKAKATVLQRALRAKVLGKNAHPVFRGRFGKRSVRKKSKAKWDKWRVPRGIDVKHVASDGFNPREGYRTPRAIRDIHPSGYREVLVRHIGELKAIKEGHAVRVISGIGRKKKIDIVDKAIEKGIKVLNP
ncbi:MAG: hypothetical protein NUV67_00750 [archaeon]|nr:hypothetical protein [archaeon]